ncbi:Mu transposase C-terminal domain-containing protein [Oscillochloris sp. ZM17-4]|uniref:Mu transposase C-terminal domain-containing protein n=1 Tax=Oscillochloris sp. ZM17-4 TaxID=2866714 RepID=UPI00351DA0D1
MRSKEYTVQRYGIHFQNNYYRDAAGVLGGFIGRRVTVFFDSRDTSRVRIWGRQNADEEPRYICTAHLQSFAPTQADRAGVATKNKQRRDKTRQEVRERQSEGKEVLKALDELDASAETDAAQGISPSESSPEPATNMAPPEHPPATPTDAPALRSNNNVPEPDDEPDYDELRRTMQRKQRGGSRP